MARANKCDRCGKYYDMGDFGVSKSGSFVTGIAYSRMNNGFEISIDLCKDCIDKLKRFIDGAEIVLEEE